MWDKEVPCPVKVYTWKKAEQLKHLLVLLDGSMSYSVYSCEEKLILVLSCEYLLVSKT